MSYKATDIMDTDGKKILEYDHKNQMVFERVKMVGDGHCLFRCMSMVIWGNQNRHQEVRQRIVECVTSKWKEYHQFVISTHGEEYNTPQKYAFFMGDLRKRTYGTEFEISIFCRIFKKNIRIFRKYGGEIINHDKNTIFEVYNLTINEEYMTHFFVFQGIDKKIDSEGHYDLLIKIDTHPKTTPLTDNLINQTPNQPINQPTNQPTNCDTTNNYLEQQRKNILDKLIAFFSRKGCCLNQLYKNSKERRRLFTEASLSLFGNSSVKNVVFVIRLFEQNYSLFKKLLPIEITDQKTKGPSEDWFGEVGNTVISTLGNKITKEQIIKGENEVQNRIYKRFCKEKNWKFSNPKNKKKFQKKWKRFLTKLIQSDCELKHISESENDFEHKVCDNNSSNEGGIQSPGKKEEYLLDTICTKITCWKNCSTKENSIMNLRKELISCHRRQNGVCTWTNFDDLNEKNYQIRHLEPNNNVVIVFKKCMVNFCENELKTYITTNGDELLIEIKETTQRGIDYDICGHCDYYEKMRYPFDAMDDILYKDRMWASVFNNCEGVDCGKTDKTSVNNVEQINQNPPHDCFPAKILDVVDGPTNDRLSNTKIYSSKSIESNPPYKHPKEVKKFLIEEGRVTGHKNDVMVNNVFNTAKFRIWLRKAIINQANICCRLIFKSSKLTNNENIKYVTYARCGSNLMGKCKEFKFELKITDIVEVRITSRGPSVPVHTGLKKAYQLRGEERKMFKDRLLLDPAKTIQNEEVKNINIDAAVELNMQSVRTLLTLRKCRSEAFKQDDLHTNDLLDLILLAKSDSVSPVEEDKYIRKVVAIPLQVFMFTSEQRKVIMRHNVPAAYFDATGSVARQVYLSNNKPILYYALVINVNGEILPVLEMLSEIHDISALADLFMTYKYFCQKSSKQNWPIIKRIVCDWSWAMMIGIVITWNAMDLLQYLRMCHNISTGVWDPQLYKDKVTIHACCAHVMKMVSDRLSKENITNKKVKQFIMGIMGLFIICSSVSEIDEIYIIFATITLSEKRYSITNSDIENVTKTIENQESVLPQAEISQESEVNVDEIEYVSGKTKIESPFFVRCCTLLERVTNKLNVVRENESATEELNIYYCPGFFDYVHQNLIPLLPFWSGLMISLHDNKNDSFNRLSNANVENYFNQVKHRLLKSQTNLKIGRLLKLLKDNVQSALRNISISMADYNKERKQTSKSKKKIGYIGSRVAVEENMNNKSTTEKPIQKESEQYSSEDSNDIDDPKIEEMWCKKRKSTGTYLLPTNTILMKQLQPDKQAHNTTDGVVEIEMNQEMSYGGNNKDINEELRTVKDITTETTNALYLGEVHDKPFRISLSKQYPHCSAMPNGLFMNPEFYVASESEHNPHVVSLYKDFVPTRNQYLFGDAYLTLEGSRQLHQNVVDCAIAALIKMLEKKKDIIFVNTETCDSLFRPKGVTAAAHLWHYFRNLNAYEKIVMPYLVPNKNHYCVLVGDLIEKKCIFYNPLPSCPDKPQVGFERFRRFISGLQKTQYRSEDCKVEKWTFIPSDGAVQNDTFNCGVYIICFVECLLKDQEMPSEINAYEYRDYVKSTLLKWSDNMSDLCIYCGKGETRCKLWIMCENCRRWAHYKPCLKYLGKSEIEIQTDDFAFICKLCQSYRVKKNKYPWE